MYFWYLKKQWKVLNYGFKQRNNAQCEKIFIACSILHNFLLDLMVRNHVRVGRKYPINNNGVWLDGHTMVTNIDQNATERYMLTQFGMRRSILANHLHVF
jgi:hypothetical protein